MPSSDDTSVWLVEITGYTDAAVSAVYRYCADPGRTGYITRPTDTPASAYYEPLVIDAGTLRRQLFASGESGARANPRAETGYGSIVLNNQDGALDAIFDSATISFRERSIRILRVAPGAAYASAVLVMQGEVGQIEHQADRIIIGCKDVLYLLASPHITTTFGGTNALPNGVDGVADIAGKAVPRIYGTVFQITPPCVNTSRLIYQVSSAAVQSGTVYDGGIALTNGADYTSQSDMETTSPAGSHVRWWKAGGMYRLGSSPARRITADVVGDLAANATVAQVLKRLALERGFSAGDVNAADVTALDALNPAVVGLYVDSQANTLDLMDQVARSIGAWYAFDRLGQLRMGRFDVPSGTAVAVIDPYNCESVERVANGEDVPTTTLQLRYAKYYTPQSRESLAGGVSPAAASDFAQGWRTSKYAGTLSPNPHRRTQIAERETLLTTKADADAEAARLYSITSVARRTHLCKGVALDDATIAALDIGAVIELRWPRWGFSMLSGTLRRVIGITYDYAARRCDLIVWGA